MTSLRTALIALLLNLTLHAQAAPTASDASAAIVDGGVAIYATLSNPTMYDVYVQSGRSDAGKVRLREGDPSTPLGAGKPTSNITIPSFGVVELKAGGPFVLVSDLKTQAKVGDTITVTLETDGGVAIAIAATIK
ncbi:MAG: copper chaperone PCu(A)C [Vicinamibacterales bacterium]